MPTIAKAPPGTSIYADGQTFEFSDGTRQVTQAEEETLRRFMAAGAAVKVTFEQKKGK
jgi:hypothetical protein